MGENKMTFIRKLFDLFSRKEDYAVTHARRLRAETDQKITKMIADLNGCSDRWFLTVDEKLDECVPANGELE